MLLGHFSDCQNNKHFLRIKWRYPIAKLWSKGVNKHHSRGGCLKGFSLKGILLYGKYKNKGFDYNVKLSLFYDFRWPLEIFISPIRISTIIHPFIFLLSLFQAFVERFLTWPGSVVTHAAQLKHITNSVRLWHLLHWILLNFKFL